MFYIKTRVKIPAIIIVFVLLNVVSIASASDNVPRITDGNNSINWAGYAVVGATNSVTDVKGSWIVPTVVSSTQNQYSSFCVGIDGYNSPTAEQIGTSSDFINGVSTYYAWYEFYPNPRVIISSRSMQVKPGDRISAEVSYSRSQFTVNIKDMTTGKSFSTSKKVNSAQRNSAEWLSLIHI